MRKLSLILLVILVSSNAFSQVKKPHNLPAFDYKQLHWGFTVGLNSMDFAFKRNPAAADYMHADVSTLQQGFQVNIVSDLRLSDYWNLRFLPGINLGARKVIYFAEAEGYESNDAYEFDAINSGFLDFPLLLKYRSKRVNNYRPYLIGGVSYRIDMTAKDEFDLDVLEGPRMLLKTSNYYIELGFGVDTYSQYFKFAPEIKLCIGLNDVLRHSKPEHYYPNEHQYVESLDALRSFIVMVNFHFE